MNVVTFNGKNYPVEHGAPFDRGSADSWYSRSRDPHWYPEGTYNGVRIGAEQMTAEEIEAYHAGYDHNEKFGGKKEW
jgi:hypothetical protein